MIPQITQINFPSYATLTNAVATFAEMGERTITTQIKIDGDVVPDFDGWELSFKGERFVLPVKEPQAAKDNTSRRSIVDLTFTSWPIDELKRYFFVEMASISAGTAIADKYKASLGLSLENFVTAFNNVLNYYFNGKIVMSLFGSGSGIYSNEPSYIEIDYTKIWDVLQKIYEIYEVRWVIDYNSTTDVYTIKVGYPAAEIDDHEFQYGYNGGLLRFERQVQDYNLTNILLGRGGEKNLPYRYFKKVDPNNPSWAGDPDAIPELANIYFENLRDINFRRYVQGWKTNPNRTLGEGDVVETYDSERGETDFAYAKGHTDPTFNPVEYVKDDESIETYGERWGALDNADDIYPTIQGIEISPYGRIDQVVDVEDVVTDDIEAMAADAAEITNVAGAERTEWIDYNSTIEVEINGADFSVPTGKVGNLTFVNTWFDTIQYAKRGSNQVSVSPTDPVHELVGINTTLSYMKVVDKATSQEISPSGIPAGNYYYKLYITVKAEFEQSMYTAVNVTVGVDGLKLTTSDSSANAWKPTFDIWVKNIWNTTQGGSESDTAYAARVWEPILGDRTGNEAKVAFSTGLLSISQDYNFTIASIPVVDRTKTINGVTSEWRITLIKSDAEYEATGKYIPNADTGGNASAGDYFFFTGIDMPHAYVLWAEERLNAYKTTELGKLKQINPTWIIKIDKVRANTLLTGETVALADRLVCGAKIDISDPRFTNGNTLTLYANTVTYTWQEPSQGSPYIVPDIEVVLSDKVVTVTSPIDKLEGSVDLIQSSYAKISDIESIVRKVASPIFLKKTGESEKSLSPTRFSSLIASESFRQGDFGGQGWGAYIDGDGHSVYEADVIVARKGMRINSLIVNQIAYLGGKQIISAASMECSKVETNANGDYVCYFDQKQGSVANHFVVNDIVLGQVWNADDSQLRYYKRKVLAVTSDSITLSATIADGTDAPQVGDVLVQFGNYTQTARQYVIVRDVIGGGYERMLSGLATVYSTGDEYYFAGRQSGSTERWFVGNSAGQYAQYQNGVLTIAGRLAVTTQIDTGNGSYEALSTYLANLQDQIDGNIQTWYASGVPTLQNYPANTWATVEDKNNHIGDLYYDSATGKAYRFMYDGTNEVYLWTEIADEDIAAALALAQQNATAISGLQYLKTATNNGTLIQGGLVLTSMMQLGQTESGVYKVYSGINGIMDSTAQGGGIAAWYGGEMLEKDDWDEMSAADQASHRYAKSLFRFDGSGYLASENIKWDANGNGQIPGISWNNGTITLSSSIYLEGGDRLTEVVDAVNHMYTQFAYDSHDNIVVKPTNAFYLPQGEPTYPLAGQVALWYNYQGNYGEQSSGGVSEVHDLTLQKNSVTIDTFQPGVADKTINISIGWSDLTPDATHRFLTDTLIGTWNAKYNKPSDGIPKTDLAAAVQTSLGKADTALQSFTETDPTVPSWAKASTKPSYSLSEITGTADLQLIEALTGAGLLRRKANNTWELDSSVYLTDYTIYALTIKNSGGTSVLSYNPKTAAAELTLTKAMVGLGNVENTALSTWAGSSNITTLGTITTGTWHGTAIANDYLAHSSLTIGNTTIALGSSATLSQIGVPSWAQASNKPGYTLDEITDGTTKTWARIVFTDTAQDITGAKKLKSVALLNVPSSAPASADIEANMLYLWADTAGNYTEEASGGGGSGETLTITKNGQSWLSYDGSQAVSLNLVVPTKVSDLDNDSGFLTASTLPIASANTLGGIKVGNNLTIDANGVLSAANSYVLPTASSSVKGGIKVGNTLTISNEVLNVVVGSVAQSNTGFVTGGDVYSAIAAAVTSALHYRGMSSTALTDGGTETAIIGGVALTPQSGDVVIYNGFEFLWENNVWNKLGDDTSYALKTIQINGDGTYITGGGDLTATRTLTLSAAVIASLGKADSALQSVAFSDLTSHPTTLSGYGITDAYTKSEADTEYAKYLPLSAGSGKALTGDLYFDASSATKCIYWKNSSNVYARALNMSSDGKLYLGADQVTNEKLTYIYGKEIYYTWGTSAASNQVRFVTNSFSPSVTDNIYLGTNSLKWKGVYATTFYGALSGNASTATKLQTARTLWGQSFDGSANVSGSLTGVTDITASGLATLPSIHAATSLSIPKVAPDTTAAWYDSSHAYLWSDSEGNYAESASGGGGGGGETLTITKNGSAWLSYNGSTAVSLNLVVPTTLAELTDDSTHRLVTDTQITAWNAKYDKPSGGIPAADLAEAYLPLTAGSGKKLTGSLYFDVSSANKSIYANLSGGAFEAIRFTTDGHTYFGIGNNAGSRNMYLYGKLVQFTFGASTGTKSLVLDTGVIRPGSNSDVSLGTSSYKWKELYATTLYGNLALSYLTGADDLKAIEALTETSGFLKKTAANTWSLTNDIEASSLKTTTESSPMFTFRHTPSVAVGDSLTLTKIKGKTIVWNQQISDTQALTGFQGSCTLSNGVYTLTASNNSATYYMAYSDNIQTWLAGHKYYISAVFKTLTLTSQAYFNIGGVTGTGRFSTTGKHSDIISVSTSGTRFAIYGNKTADTSGVSMSFEKVQIIDLTAEFGSGNEPTSVAEFEILYPLGYYSQSANRLLSLTASALQTTGKNIWDEEWEIGEINASDGQNSSSSNAWRTKNYIPVIPGGTYYIYAVGYASGLSMRGRFYDANKNYIGYRQGNSYDIVTGQCVVPSNAYYLRFAPTISVIAAGTKICVSKYDASFNGQYEPYKESTKRLDITDLVPANKPTLRLNQLVQNGDFSDGLTGWSRSSGCTYSVSGGIMSVGVSSAQQNITCFTSLSTITGHKYYVRLSMKIITSITGNTRIGYFSNSTQWLADAEPISNFANWATRSVIITSNYNNTILRVGGYGSTSSTKFQVGDEVQLKDVICIDLTEMYGAGDEPTSTALIEELIGTDYIPYNTGEDIPNRIYPKGAKSAGTACDVIRQTDTDRVIGVVDLGTLTWTVEQSVAFRAAISSKAYGMANLLCAKYTKTEETVVNMPDKTIKGNNSGDYIYIKDSTYSTAAEFKAAMSGVMLYYELATPEHFDLLDPLDLMLPSDALGTQRLLPENGATPTTAPMVAEITYGANAGDIVGNIDTQLSVLNNRINTFGFDDLASHPTTLSGYGITDAVPSSRKVNNKALSSDITLTLDDLADGSTRKLADYLPLAGGTLTGNLLTTNIYPSSNLGGALGSTSLRFGNAWLGQELHLDDSATVCGIYRGASTQAMRMLATTLRLGEGYAVSGGYTDIYGEQIRLYYGTSKTLGLTLDSSGNLIASGAMRIAGNIRPNSGSDTNSIGQANYPFTNIYGKTITASTSLVSSGTLSVTGAATLSSTLGVGGSITPSVSTADLGNSNYPFRDLYLSQDLLMSAQGAKIKANSQDFGLYYYSSGEDDYCPFIMWDDHDNIYIGNNYDVPDIHLQGDTYADLFNVNTINSDNVNVSAKLAIPTSAPSSPVSGKSYLWIDTNGNYAELPNS